jgi:plasmid stability protein
MAANSEIERVRLSIDLDPELRQKMESAAAKHDVSVADYVLGILQRALAEEEHAASTSAGAAWGRISARSFARDWQSDEDKVYDDLP